MSNASQIAFLEKLNAELNRYENYRGEVANLQAHRLTISRRAINRGIADALRFEFDGISNQEINAILKKVSQGVGKVIRDTATTIRGQQTRDPKGVELLLSTHHTIKAIFHAKGSNRFDKAYKSYRDHLEAFMPSLNQAVFDVLGQTKDLNKRDIWNLEHFKFKGVLESQVKDAIDNALADQTDIDMAQVDAFLSSRGVSLRVYRNTKTDTMEVFLGSFRANIAEGQISKERKKVLQQELNNALEKLQNEPTFAFATLKGSDSFADIKRKKLVKSTTDPFKKVKNVTVKTEDTKIKHSVTDNTVTKKGKGRSSNRLRRKSLRKRKRAPSPAAMPLFLITELNKKLPQVIQKNMGFPGLENRTGRFAASVKVTDVVKTPKGYPSIGYTYQRNPYQVFETGSKGAWSSAERDPRNLIDKSIREIAATMAIGRFYTRRV